MGNCCTLRERDASIEYSTKGLVSSNGHNINEVQNSLLYVNRFFEDSKFKQQQILYIDRDAQMVVFCFAKDQLRNFVIFLSQLMTVIKTKTNQIFIPTVLQNSPINTQKEMLIVMRNIEKLDKFTIERDLILDESKLSKSFTIRTFQFLTSDPKERKDQLKNDLMTLYRNEGLMIIGGIQDPGKINNMHLLFYKQESFNNPNKKDAEDYQITIEVQPDILNEKDFEILLNQALVDSNTQLRTILTFEDTYSRHHFIVMQEQQEDKIYMVAQYPSYINEEHSAVLKELRQMGKVNDFIVRQAFAEKMSQYMNIQEKKNGTTVVECITNNSLKDSYVIYSQ